MDQHYTGQNIQNLPTPCLVVDYDTLTANLAKMQGMVDSYNRSLRPHIKTHKCSRVARMQIEAGAIGVTCATIGEAEAMAAGGIRDILIANQLVTHDKLKRAARLMQRADLKFAVDSIPGIQAAAEVASDEDCVFEVLVEVDTGGKRCGAQTPEEAVRLIECILESPSLRFGGIQAYYGGTSYIKDLQERERVIAASDAVLAQALEAARKVCEIPRVSGAGSGNARYHLQNGLLTEIQSGSYVYSDTTYRELASEYRTALFVLTTVLSRPVNGRVVMDAGLKSMGAEFSIPEVIKYPELVFDHYSEEHVQWTQAGGEVPSIGEKVLVIPSHCCTTVNHHRRCFVIRDEDVLDEWVIDAF
jgi:D-serine deaminase-like pyridoxal phosphate-dependent protein